MLLMGNAAVTLVAKITRFLILGIVLVKHSVLDILLRSHITIGYNNNSSNTRSTDTLLLQPTDSTVTLILQIPHAQQ